MLRFFCLLLLLLPSLLTVFPAPAYPFWLAAILVDEYGWVFILFTALSLVSGWYVKRWRLAGTIVGVAATLFYLNPVIQAVKIARQVPQQMNTVFPLTNKQQKTKPFTVVKMFNSVKPVNYQTIKYTSYKDTTLTLDFYQADTKSTRPCVIVVHGGSWSGGDSRQLPELNSMLARQGYQVASVNYRLAPEHRYPDAIEDVRQCIGYLKVHAEKLHIDTTQLILLGRSAGAQIALMAAYQSPDAGLKGVIDFYGPADMVWGYSVPANPLVFNSRQIMERYLGGTPQQKGDIYTASSPVEYVNASTVPTLIIHGQNDVLVAYEHSRRLNAKLQQYHVPHYLLTLPWATHGFDYHLNGPGGQLSTYAVVHFLQSVTH